MSQRPPFPVDLQTLLAPISADRPAGEWLRYEGTYDRIQDARREDDANLPQGIWKTAQKRANWQAVSSLCQEALRARSKDLQIAAWLLEAWVHQHGYRGLAEGLRLIHGLCAGFWETIYPALDPEDPSFRTAPIEWIDQKVSLQLKLHPLTRPDGEEARAYSFSDWELTLHRTQAARSEEDPGAVNEARFLASASLTPRALLLTAGADLADAQGGLTALEALLDERLGWQASTLLQLREATQAIRHLITQLTGPETGAQAGAGGTAEPEAPEDERMAASQEAGDGGSSGGGGHGPIRSRAEAYQRLQEAADYLMRTEPHSPTPYLVKRAVAWGNKTLGELLAEVVGSEQHLQEIYQLLAIKGR